METTSAPKFKFIATLLATLLIGRTELIRLPNPDILQFKIVFAYGISEAEAMEQIGGKLGNEYELVTFRARNPSGDQAEQALEYLVVKKQADLNGKIVKSLKIDWEKINCDSGSENIRVKRVLGQSLCETPARILLEFKKGGEGSEKFAELTGNNVGKRLAVMIDNTVVNVPVIQCKIWSKAQIEGPIDMKLIEALKKNAKSIAK